jgi:hypothetical protein
MKYFFSFLILSCGNKSNTSIEEDQSSEEHKFQEIENFLGRWPKEYFPLALIFDNQLDSLKNNLFETLNAWNNASPYMNFFENSTEEISRVHLTEKNLNSYFKNIDLKQNQVSIHYLKDWNLLGFKENVLGSIYIKYKKIKDKEFLLIEKAIIILNGSIPNFDLPSILLHEVGHLLGLDHHPEQDAVMYAYLSPHKKKHTLIEEEINTLNDLYEEYYSSNQTSKNFITDVNEEYSEEDYYGVKHIKIL